MSDYSKCETKADAPAPVRAAAQTRVNLFLKCSDLPSTDALSLCDPFAEVFLIEGPGGSPGSGCASRLGRTETARNNANPVFATHIKDVDYLFETEQTLRIAVYDADPSGHSTLIGDATVSLGSVVSKGDYLRLRLGKGSSGCVYIKAQSTDSGTYYEATFRLAARGLTPGGNPCIGKEAIAEFVQDDCVIGQSGRKRIIVGCVSWNDPVTVKFLVPKGTDPKDVTWIVSTYWDAAAAGFLWDKLGIDTGHSRTRMTDTKVSVAKLVSASPMATCISGLEFSDFRLERIHSWLEYLQGGLKVHVIPVFDLTGSNGHPRDSKSLHRIVNGSAAQNAYYTAFQAVGSVLEPYAHEAAYPVFGFGHLPPGSKTGLGVPCGSLIPDDQRRTSVAGVKGVLDTYEAAIKKFDFSGPTLFGPVLDAAIRRVDERAPFTADDQNYSVVLILTDGEIDDMSATKKALVCAARKPMSVIIVGIGNADFKNMEELDGDEVRVQDDSGRKCVRDIVQFVPMRDFTGKNWERRLAASVLKELPGQILEFARAGRLRPGRATAAWPAAPASASVSVSAAPTYFNSESAYVNSESTYVNSEPAQPPKYSDCVASAPMEDSM